MTKANAKRNIAEFSRDIEGQRWTKNQVNNLTVSLLKESRLEQGRILAFCEINNYRAPEVGDFKTLEAFKAALES